MSEHVVPARAENLTMAYGEGDARVVALDDVIRALVCEPDIIFADEPTGNFDSRSGEDVLLFLRSSGDRLGQTIVMVTHDPVATGYTDRVVFLSDGRVGDEMRRPTAAAVLEHMKQFEHAGRGAR